MAGVERISENIADGVHAGAIVSTMSQAVQELVSNSIDSGASSVEVKLDLPSYRLSVADNGRGIPKEKLQSLVATARATSKASSTEEMQHAPTYGFRGEALHSLGLTSLLEIQSRCAGKEPHAKVVREGQTLHFGPARSPVRTGTVVTLRDAFFKWPVRRRAANDVAEMARIKDYVSRIALVNNGVAFSVHDSGKGKVLLKTAATGNVVKTFAQVFSSDKLTSARKLVFNFKQFRITGYLSPPSSTACHWSKEFQFVYVNCRSVRRLDFVQRTINAAFAPCLALLCGRGGADGQQQGVVRKARNHNASSGQRQELFPAFVLNVECPRSEVDVMVDPEKTWVEFSDWTAARNACVAMLLAFLPHFPHAVPGSVLRDLRRVFHKNEGDGGGGEGWTQASPPSAPRRHRASPEIPPAPSPSPPPMRLAVPDVGLPSPNDSGFGSPQGVEPGGENGCAWMGRERRAPGRMGGDGGEAMEFQDYGIRAEGVLYPSPASRFGARDNGGLSSHSVATTGYPPFDEPVDGFCRSLAGSGGAGGHAVDGTATVSSHFACLGQGRDGFDEGDYRHHRQRRCYLDDVGTTDAYNGGGDGHPIGSPHFSRSRGGGGSGGGGRSDRESGRPRRLALEEHPPDEVNHGGGRRRSEEDRGVYEPPAALDFGDVLPPSCESCHGPGEWIEAIDWGNGGGGGGGGNKGSARTADRARALEVGDAGDSRGSWAAGRPGLRSEALERKGAALPPPRRRSPPLEPVPSLENAAREPDCDRAGTGEGSRVGRRRQRRREDRRSGRGSPPIPSREDPSGSWLRQLPGAAEEMLTGGHGDRGEAWAGEGDNALSLSRLFDYAFADDDRHRGRLPEQVGGPGGMGGSGGGRSGARAGFQLGLGGAASGGSRGIGSDRSLSPRLAPNSPARTGGGSGGPVKKPLVGVTVRRPPSPQFSFMQEACLPAGDGGGGKGAVCGVSPGPPAALSVQPTGPLGGGRQDMQAMSSASDFDVGYGPDDAQQQEQQEQRRQQRGQWRGLASPTRSPLRRMDRPCNEDTGESPAAWEPPLAANDSPSSSSPRRRRADRSLPLSGDPGRWTNSSPELGAEPGRTPPHPRKRRRPVAWGLRGAAAPTAEPPLLPHVHEAGDMQEGSPEAERRRRPASTAGPCANGRQDVGDDEEGGSGSGDGWLAWGARGRGYSPSCPRSGGWWGQKGDDGCPLSDDRSPGAPAAIAASTGRGASSGPLEADNSSHLTGAIEIREALGPDGASGRRRDREAQRGHGGGPRTALPREEEQQACAEEDAARPPGTEISRRSGEMSRPTPEGEENVEVCGSAGGGDGPVSGGGAGVRDQTRAAGAALAYDQDVLGGDGFGSLEPTTIQGVLEKFLAPAEEGANDEEEEECDSCHVSDAGGAAVYSPRGPGGGRARKPSVRAERVSGPAAAAASAAAGPYAPSSRTRERPISEVLQAGRDEIGAGAGAVAVTVTPEELGQACLIGQAGRKFVILRAKTGAILCVDQHAADERVKLEELERQVYGPGRDRRNVEKLRLDPPEKLSVTQSDADLLEEHRQVLVSWNFEIKIEGGQHGGGGTAPIEAFLLAVPVVCGVRLSVQDLSAFLRYLRESVEPGSSAGLLKPPQVQHILNYKACHSAIRFGDLLSRSECADLIRKLAACAFPFCCAHGRPSVVPLCVLGGAAPSSRASLGGGSGGGSLWAAGGKRKR